jgi:beta-glucosidase
VYQRFLPQKEHRMSFAEDFVWGAAAASYQIEGAAYEDGKGLSDWDVFCQKPGAVWNGHTGDVACDHYHRYQEDVALMKEIGLHAYRFSISWPRILPEGVGAVNPEGLEFYDRLVDELLAADITPYITLFHWDYPDALYRRDGWLNPASSDWFAEYTKVIVEKLSDRVAHWMTFNEPQVFIVLGHQQGTHAPGDRLQSNQILQIIHNMLLAHGKSTQMIRSHAETPPQVGFVLAASAPFPATASESPEDVEAAQKALFDVTKNHWGNFSWWTDPIILGRYPEDGLTRFKHEMPAIGQNDLQIIGQPLDFLGLNIYFGHKIAAGKNGEPEAVQYPDGHPLTTFSWPIAPECIYWTPKLFWERYQIPLMITENGMANTDLVSLDGHVHDPQRIDYLQRYLLELQKAYDEGVDLRGYFAWSILDNFEWAEGYKQRFGLIYVDYTTQQRILKDSAHWYKKVIASNGADLQQ